MKRGLKVKPTTEVYIRTLCYNRFPDEKGTESMYLLSSDNRLIKVTTVSPDEKGTERRILFAPNAIPHRLQPFPR